MSHRVWLPLALFSAALTVSACGQATWNDALRDAEHDGPAVARGELAFVAGKDAERGLALALETLAQADPGSDDAARAILLALETSRALGRLEAPLPYLAEIMAATGDPLLAERLAAEQERYVARLDGHPIDESRNRGDVTKALEALRARRGNAWEPARTEATRQLAQLVSVVRGQEAANAIPTGVITSWRLSAPWGTSSERDFDKILGPETRPLADAERTGWGWDLVPVPTTRAELADGEVLFFDLPNQGGIGFAETTLTIPGGGPARLRLESNRRVRAYLNGHEVLARTDLDAPWRSQTDLVLGAQGDRLSLKLASTDGTGFFRVQVTPLEGPDRPTPASAEPELAVGDARAVVRAFAEADALLSRPRLDRVAAERRLQALTRVVGPHPAIALLRARLARLDPLAPPATQRADARRHLDAALATWPDNPVALRALARLEREDERLDQALALLSRTLPDARTLLERLDLERTRGWEADAFATADTLRALPGLLQNSPKVGAELVDLWRAFGRISAARAEAESLDQRFPGTGLGRRAELALDAGDRRAAADLFLRAYRMEPERHAHLRAFIAALRADGAPESLAAADAELQRFLTLRPRDAWALAERARIQIQAGHVADAVKMLDDVLAAHPDFAPVENLLLALAGKPEPLDDIEDGRLALERYRASPEAPSWTSYPLVSVVERSYYDVRSDGSTVELQHRVRLIQTRAGADALGDFRAPDGARLLVARTLKADGRVLYPERTEGKTDLSFPELQIGDAVETAWVARSRVNVGEGGYLTGVSFAGWSAPTWRHTATVHVAPGLRLATTAFGGAPMPESTTASDGSSTWTWPARALPAVTREPLAVAARSFFPFTDLRIVKTLDEDGNAAWRAIATMFAERLAQKTIVGERVRALARRLGTLEKAFSWVKTDLEDVEQLNLFESTAETAVASGKGHRAVVLRGLARALGRSTELWLCAPERDGPPEDRASPTPNANRFFYPLVVVPGADQRAPVFLDPSRPWMPWGEVPGELRGARCLVPERIAAPDDAPTEALFADVPQLDPRTTPPSFAIDVDVVLAADGDATMNVIGHARGAPSVALRQLWQGLDEARQQALWEQWAAELVLAAKVTGFAVYDADQAERDLRFEVSLAVPGWARRDGDALVVERPLPSLLAASFASVPPLAQLGGLPARKTPLRVSPHAEDVRLRIVFPDGFEPVAPASLALAHGRNALEQSARVDDRMAIIERRVRLTAGRIEPDQYSAAFRSLIDTAERTLTAPIRGKPIKAR